MILYFYPNIRDFQRSKAISEISKRLLKHYLPSAISNAYLIKLKFKKAKILARRKFSSSSLQKTLFLIKISCYFTVNLISICQAIELPRTKPATAR